MNRSDAVKAIVWLDQMAARAKTEASLIRAALEADATAEFLEQGTAPTWRLPDLGTVALSVSKETVVMADEDAFTAWAANRYPSEVVTQTKVRPAWLADFLQRATVHEVAPCEGGCGGDTVALDSSSGEVVPGLAVRAGGQPIGISVRPSADAKAVYAAVAEQSLKRLAVDAGPSVPVVLAELAS